MALTASGEWLWSQQRGTLYEARSLAAGFFNSAGFGLGARNLDRPPPPPHPPRKPETGWGRGGGRVEFTRLKTVGELDSPPPKGRPGFGKPEGFLVSFGQTLWVPDDKREPDEF